MPSRFSEGSKLTKQTPPLTILLCFIEKKIGHFVSDFLLGLKINARDNKNVQFNRMMHIKHSQLHKKGIFTRLLEMFNRRETVETKLCSRSCLGK